MFLLSLIVFSAGVAFSLLALRIISEGVDDAHITIRYAENLVRHHGFFWNIESPLERVEGFTSFLWTMICAAAVLLNPQSVEGALLLFNVLFLALSFSIWLNETAVLFTSRVPLPARRKAVARWGFSFTFLLWLAINPGFFVWSTISLMETGLWTGLLLIAMVASLHYSAGRDGAYAKYYVVFLVLPILARPEGLLCSVVLFSLTSYFRSACQGDCRTRAKRECLRNGALLLVFVGALHLLRYIYFGYPFPNTYYAKVDTRWSQTLKQGVSYLLEYVGAYPAAGCVFLLSAAVFLEFVIIRGRKRAGEADAMSGWREAGILSSALVLTAGFIPLATGGDHFALGRAMQPFWLFMGFTFVYVATSVLEFIAVLVRKADAVFACAAAALFLFACSAVIAYPVSATRWDNILDDSEIIREFIITRKGKALALSMNALFSVLPRYPSTGMIMAGSFGRFYSGSTIDLMGLNDATMAHATRSRDGGYGHSAFHKETFFRRKPDLMLPIPCSRERPVLVFEHEEFFRAVLGGLERDALFQASYQPVVFDLPDNSGKAICAYASTSFLKVLEPSVPYRTP